MFCFVSVHFGSTALHCFDRALQRELIVDSFVTAYRKWSEHRHQLPTCHPPPPSDHQPAPSSILRRHKQSMLSSQHPNDFRPRPNVYRPFLACAQTVINSRRSTAFRTQSQGSALAYNHSNRHSSTALRMRRTTPPPSRRLRTSRHSLRHLVLP